MGNADAGVNQGYIEIMRSQWREDPAQVPDDWRNFFASGEQAQATEERNTEAVVPPAPAPAEVSEKNNVANGITDVPLLGVARKIVENMQASLQVPTAMSLRDIPVKVLEENRLVINQYLAEYARPKCSFTHLIAFAIVKAVMRNQAMNCTFVRDEQGKFAKRERTDINLGIAIDLPGKNGGRSLVVPNIKKCQNLDFWAFFNAFNDCIDRAKRGKLTLEDYQDTTISLTNPGGIGTLSSSPRLMQGQSAIIATGSIGYPAEYEATSPETIHAMGIGKVMSVSSTYDHRVIQGAESGLFLDTLHKLLVGEFDFFDEVFKAVKIPHHAFKLKQDRAVMFGFDSTFSQTERAMRVSQMIHAYRVRGYMVAHSDPLDLRVRHHAELDLENYGLTIWDLDRDFDTLGLLPQKRASLRIILAHLRQVYCQRMGVEYMYIADVDQKKWLQEKVEQGPSPFSLDEKKQILRKIVQAESFEHFLHKRFVGHKRFSIEGAESTIAALTELFNCAASFGVSEAIMGMSHRGRLNVLANIIGKPYEAIFAEFEDIDPKTIQGTGDVKYHLGAKGLFRWKGVPIGEKESDERSVRLRLACNPSHLEAVDPVVEGQVRAHQDLAGDRDRNRIIAVLLHGDAAFSAQGIVYETMQLANLQGYATGGTIHFIINNQIGYTTPPELARSAVHCSDIARALSVPVFRVNGDDPESCLRAIRLAFEYRMRFNRDAVVDMVCYRRHGHNEGDEPSFTQPILYQAIQQHDSVAKIYSDYLIRKGEISQAEVEAIEKEFYEIFDKALQAVRKLGTDALSHDHLLFEKAHSKEVLLPPTTAVKKEVLEEITRRVTFEPKSIKIHPRILTQVLQRRHQMVFENKPGIDFGMAEILAYGSLLLEGIPVRVSGQDCGRGTFAHRHAVLYDVSDGKPYIPLNHLQHSVDEEKASWHPSRFRIYDSPLSETGVVGFEYGYSVSHPNSLVIWEAQFGDFFNGAQVQVDQFIASAETKWGQTSGLTMFLPHGYDGQGPEHSSGRIERFLQLCADDNMRVCICSSSAQQFHLLRLQAKSAKKPLILATHKSLLRSEKASSPLADFSSGSFLPVIDDQQKKIKKSKKRLIFCAGKIYWELTEEREKIKNSSVYFVRVEQLYPFPLAEIQNLIKAYATDDIVWLQEEPKNQGAYEFVAANLRDAGVSIRYIGRAASASPATGSPKVHKLQQSAIINEAFL